MEETTFNLRLDNISVDNYSFKNPTKKFNIVKKGFVGFSFSFKFGVNFNSRNLEIKILLLGTIKETEEEILTSQVTFTYNIKELVDIVKIDDNSHEMSIPDEFLEVLISLSVSTFRGIIYEKNMGTLIQNEIIPIVDTKSMIKNMDKNNH